MAAWTGLIRRLARLRRRCEARRAADLGEVRLGAGFRLRLLPSDVMHRSILESGLYEVHETYALWRLGLLGGGLLIDVGANFGYYSGLWASLCPTNRVVAVEASPRCLPALRHNLALNGLEPRVRVVPCAAGLAAGRLRFEVGPPEQTGWGGLASHPTAGVEVPVERLERLISPAELQAASRVVLKVDVEGVDAWVLEGARELLDCGLLTHVLFEEQAPRARELGIAPGAGRRLLAAHGFTVLPLGHNWLALAPGVGPPSDGPSWRARFAREALRGPSPVAAAGARA